MLIFWLKYCFWEYLKKIFFSSFDQPQYRSSAFEIAKLCCYWLKGVQNVGICVATSYNGMTIYRNKNRCSRLKNIFFCSVEEPENNIHHDQEGSCWNNFTNFFKNVKYNILGVTVRASIVWLIVYVIAIIINIVGDTYANSCENGKFFQRALF